MDLGVSGLASNFDWRALVDQLVDIERTPQFRWRTEQSNLERRNTVFGSIKSQLGTLKSKVDALKDPNLFSKRIGSSDDASIATASAATGAALGTYSFAFSQLATAARQAGGAGISASLSATNDVSSLTLASAGFALPVTEGAFSVNGQEVSVAATDTLQAVFDRISTATGGSVTASYDSATDKISLTSASAVVLGRATDTSNFLQAAKLYNNGTGSIESSASLSGIKASTSLASSNFATAISDGGGGAGVFKINGVSIQFSASTDSLNNVLTRINESAAGVTATYDSASNRLLLTNKSTGDVGISLEDVTGNFLAATKLSTGALERGNNLLYSVNGGAQLVSLSNTITEASSGIAGLTVTALKQDTTNIKVGSDVTAIRQAITDFVAEYNKAQTLIDTQTASTTDSKGKVTAGLLTGDQDAASISSKLRNLAFAEVPGLSSAMNHLSDLGIDTGGFNDQLTISDGAKLDQALAANLNGVRSLFADATNGLASKLSSFLSDTTGDAGSLTTKQTSLTKQISDLGQQIINQERQVQSHRSELIARFVVMEKAQAQINQQLQFLSQRFGS